MRRLPFLSTVGWVLLGFFVLGTPRVFAIELQVESPSIAFDKTANRYTYQDARLTLGELVVFASSMVIETDTGRIQASGFIRVRSGTVYGDATRLELNAKTRTGLLENADLYDAKTGYYFHAEQLHILADGSLELERCWLTTCPPGVAGWRLAASSLDLLTSDTAVAYNATLKAGEVPVFWLPVLAWPTTPDRRSGVLIPRLSYETSTLPRLNLGFRLKVPIFIDLGVDQDLTVTPEYIQNRNGALGLEYNYAFQDNQRGEIYVWGIKEQKARNPADENDILPPGKARTRDPHPTRYIVDWYHNQGFDTGTRLVLSYEDSSDGQVRREYQGVLESRPYQTYQASLTQQSGWGNLALAFEQNADYRDESIYANSKAYTDIGLRPQLLPRLTYRIGGHPWQDVPLYAGLNTSAARFVATEAVSGRVYTASPTLSLPLSLGGSFEVQPTLTRHFASYEDLRAYNPDAADTALPGESFAQNEAEMELRARFARVFRGEDGPRTVLKHRMTPRLVLTTLEDVAQPLPDQVLRARPAEQLVTLRLDNSLLAQSPPAPGTVSAVRELGHLNVIQRYNLLLADKQYEPKGPPLPSPQETEPGEPLLPLILDTAVFGQGYSIGLSFHYHHQLSRLTESTVGLSGSVSPHTRLGIQHRYNEFTYFTPGNRLVPQTNAFGFNGETAFTDNFSMGFDGRLNLQYAVPPLNRRLDQALVFMDYHPSCYRVRLSYQEAVSSTVQAGATEYFMDHRVLFTFELSGLIGANTPGQAITFGQ